VHAQHGVQRDLAAGCAENEIRTGGVAHRAAGPEIAMQFAAGLFPLQADIAVLRLETALLTTLRATPATTGRSRSMAPIANARSRLPPGEEK
jgi:hypothetical protein